MDFLDLIITIAILAVGGLLTGSKKGKKAARQHTADAGPVAKPSPFKSIFADNEEPSFDVFDEEWSEANSEEDVEETPEMKEDGLGIPYFSYESRSFQQNSSFAEKSKNVDDENENFQPLYVANEEQEPLRGLLGESFDLRKAFIYQTIMERVEC